ncbi:MAG: hypothetical protein JSW61_03835 [Candidatus Thorarchaeota archaeon]|nr:MAG: hypothetical protein JSW61_03835 [Candidatus Thorarchaeota archaeon]
MTEDNDEARETDEYTHSRDGISVRRSFNPMITWVYMCAALGFIYAAGAIGGSPFLIIASLFFVVWIVREAIFILRLIGRGFPRTATYINVIHAMAWFVVLVINLFTIEQLGFQLILPEWENMTILAPVFICTGVFGITNIRLMYL